MSVNFRNIISQLRDMTEKLQQRCLEAEAHVQDLNYQLEQKNEEIKALKFRNSELVMRYENLKAGVASNSDVDLSGIKDQYKKMIREVDACLELLQNSK